MYLVVSGDKHEEESERENHRMTGGGKVTKMTRKEKVNDEQQEVQSI